MGLRQLDLRRTGAAAPVRAWADALRAAHGCPLRALRLEGNALGAPGAAALLAAIAANRTLARLSAGVEALAVGKALDAACERNRRLGRAEWALLVVVARQSAGLRAVAAALGGAFPAAVLQWLDERCAIA